MELGCMSIGIASFVSSPRRRPLPIILLAPRFPGIMTGKNTHGRRMEEDGRKEWDAEKGETGSLLSPAMMASCFPSFLGNGHRENSGQYGRVTLFITDVLPAELPSAQLMRMPLGPLSTSSVLLFALFFSPLASDKMERRGLSLRCSSDLPSTACTCLTEPIQVTMVPWAAYAETCY